MFMAVRKILSKHGFKSIQLSQWPRKVIHKIMLEKIAKTTLKWWGIPSPLTITDEPIVCSTVSLVSFNYRAEYRFSTRNRHRPIPTGPLSWKWSLRRSWSSRRRISSRSSSSDSGWSVFRCARCRVSRLWSSRSRSEGSCRHRRRSEIISNRLRCLKGSFHQQFLIA